MHTEWDHAHTDFGAAPRRAAPTGLAATEADWRQHLEQTPNGHLLGANALLDALTAGAPVRLMHLTRSVDQVRASGQLLASTGCLVGAVYGAPLTELAGGALRPHNLGAHMLGSRGDLDSRRGSTPLVIEVVPERPGPVKGLDYLRLGAVHLRTYRALRHTLTTAEDERVTRSVTDRVHATAPLLDLLLYGAAGQESENQPFVDALADAVPDLPYLGYLYFEAVAEYLMLHSRSRATQECAEHGELNNHLYKQLAFDAVASMGTLFDLGQFQPGHARLLDLIGRIEPGLADGVAAYVRRRVAHQFAATGLAPGQDVRDVSFQRISPDQLEELAPHLLGQLLFREVRLLDRYPQLYHVFEQAKALEAWTYWNTEGICLPFNGACGPKGEVGVNPAAPNARFAVWTADLDERGLLHPVEQLTAVPVPRLVPWLVAPLRDRTQEERWNNRAPVPA
ncbi:hypothetical protein F7Q99_28070 [Streptomyces kaniharaensis]|uniref:Uncharacterized protein n=1 Tax=Streptomyces kaniharaensis TaxID=212423 RepID=A0A6N7KWV9_9ACTN|nr:hypothetical protein [Streptomyces kaniharaensis]MQS16000.1 hypothetical protein [Streptomyces kaniharaensis]